VGKRRQKRGKQVYIRSLWTIEVVNSTEDGADDSDDIMQNLEKVI